MPPDLHAAQLGHPGLGGRGHLDCAALARRRPRAWPIGAEGYATASWALQPGDTAWRFIRLLTTGKNQGGFDHLRVSGFEIYGALQLA